MARNYVKGSGKTGRINGKMIERNEAKYYMGVKVQMVPENKSGLTGRYSDRRITARPTEQQFVPIEAIGYNDPALLAVTGDDHLYANTEPSRELDWSDHMAEICDAGEIDWSVQAENEPYHV